MRESLRPGLADPITCHAVRPPRQPRVLCALASTSGSVEGQFGAIFGVFPSSLEGSVSQQCYTGSTLRNVRNLVDNSAYTCACLLVHSKYLFNYVSPILSGTNCINKRTHEDPIVRRVEVGFTPDASDATSVHNVDSLTRRPFACASIIQTRRRRLFA